MSEHLPTNETYNNQLSYSEESLDANTLKRFESFYHQEKKQFDLTAQRLKETNQDLYKTKLQHISFLVQGLKSVRDFIDLPEYEGKIIFANRGEEIIGVAVTGFINDLVCLTFTGVSWEHKHKLVGSSLILKRMRYLRQLGIRHFKTNLWEGSLKAYQKVLRLTQQNLEYKNDAFQIKKNEDPNARVEYQVELM